MDTIVSQVNVKLVSSWIFVLCDFIFTLMLMPGSDKNPFTYLFGDVSFHAESCSCNT